MDYMNSILTKHNYSVMRVKQDTYYIIKNERGTYSELNDYVLEVKLSPDNKKVLSWIITEISIDKAVLKGLPKGSISLAQFCEELSAI